MDLQGQSSRAKMGCKPLNCHYKMGTQRGATEHSRDDRGGGFFFLCNRAMGG